MFCTGIVLDSFTPRFTCIACKPEWRSFVTTEVICSSTSRIQKGCSMSQNKLHEAAMAPIQHILPEFLSKMFIHSTRRHEGHQEPPSANVQPLEECRHFDQEQTTPSISIAHLAKIWRSGGCPLERLSKSEMIFVILYLVIYMPALIREMVCHKIPQNPSSISPLDFDILRPYRILYLA